MLETFDLTKYNEALDKPDHPMCIEAAICYAFGLPHNGDPQCISKAVRIFEIKLNDSGWSSPQVRAEGLRELGLAQLGSLGVIDDVEFLNKLTLSMTNILIPTVCRELYPDNENILQLASQCEETSTVFCKLGEEFYGSTLYKLGKIFYEVTKERQRAFHGYQMVENLSSAANHNVYEDCNLRAAACYVGYSVLHASVFSANPDKYLKLAANLAVNVLKELNSPGCQFLTR